MDAIRTISLSELLRLSRPVSGTSSLDPTSGARPPSRPALKRHKPNRPVHSPPSARAPLEPLNYPTILVGTVDLPAGVHSGVSQTCHSNNGCLSFSDGTARVCCDVLGFDLDVIRKEIRVLAWNFIPFKHGGGVLEIIRWDFAEPVVTSTRDGISHGAAPLSVRGLIGSISPVFTILNTAGQQQGSSGDEGRPGSGSIGFLTELLTCECGLCDKAIDHPHQDRSRHSFTKSVHVYFHGSASSWHPVLSKLVGGAIEFSELKKKQVFMKGEETYLMLVSTDKTMMHKCPNVIERTPCRRRARLKRGELGAYDGVVTGVYMQGLIVELDDNVWLLLSDVFLAPPHSLRVGALISVRNVHFINPSLSWTNVLLLGACVKTSVSIKSFSPSDTKFPAIIRTQSLLSKFIESLTFSAKFWVLILISCFIRKFSKVFTDKEILGSKRKEGLAHIYARSCLQSFSYQCRNGVFLDFCKHNSCICGNQSNYPPLVAPLSIFLQNSKVIWMSLLSQTESSAEVPMTRNHIKQLDCKGHLYSRLTRKIISCKDLSVVLMGSLRVSPLGRLQLFDTTGSIDVIIPDLLSEVSESIIYEVRDYKLVIEGLPTQCESVKSDMRGSLSCTDIFRRASKQENLDGLTIYVYFYLSDSSCLNTLLHFPVIVRGDELCGSNATFHLLLLTHKFPAFCHIHSDNADGSRSFAEALFLPYDLVIHSEHGDNELISRIENKINAEAMHDATPLSNAGKCLWKSRQGHNREGFLEPNCLFNGNEREADNLMCKQKFRKIMLEFQSDSLNQYQQLKIGSYYILQCSNTIFLGSNRMPKNCTCSAKTIISPQRPLWSVLLSVAKSKNQVISQGDEFVGISPARTTPVDSGCKCEDEIFFSHSRNQPQAITETRLQLSAERLAILKTVAESHEDGIIKGLGRISDFPPCAKVMTAASLQHSLTAKSNHMLPKGNLISLRAEVLDIHFFPPSSSVISFLYEKGITNVQSSSVQGVCIHIHEGDHMVNIRGNLSKHTYPLGLGPGVNATFHRLLISCDSNGWLQLALTPASFIVINSVREVDQFQKNDSLFSPSSFNVQNGDLLDLMPIRSISPSIQSSNSEVLQLHGRVTGILTVVFENQILGFREPVNKCRFKKASIGVPLAAVIMDDSSSLLCCWADADRAQMLLNLQECVLKASFKGRFPMKKSERTGIDTLGKILNRHHRITVKNYGAIADPSSLDFTFSIKSSKVLRVSEENFLKVILTYACGGPVLKIVGSVIDLNAIKKPDKFIDMEIARHLARRNIRAIQVEPVDPLIEARSLLDELLTG